MDSVAYAIYRTKGAGMAGYGGDGGTTPAQRPPGSHAATRGISRRLFLQRSGTALVSGLVAARLGAVEQALAHAGDGQAEPHLPIWAATTWSGRYWALAGSADDPAIHALDVDGDGRVTLGSALGVALPDGFVALALLGAGSRLLVAGGVLEEVERLTVDHRPDHVHPDDREALPDDAPAGIVTVPVLTLRPAVYEVTDAVARELPLGAQVRVAYGAATAIAAPGAGQLAVAIEGSDEVEQAYNDVVRAAESIDGGTTWDASVLAAGLGEGLPSHLVATGRRLVAVTIDAEGRRTFHERAAAPGRDWQPAPADGSDGPVLALVPAGGDAVDLVDRSSDHLRRRRYEGSGSRWQPAGTVETADAVVALVGVSGSRELVAVGASSARLTS